MFIVIFIFVVGLVLLLTNLGILTVGVWDIVWPVLIMVFAISLYMHKMGFCKGYGKGRGYMFDHGRGRCWGDEEKKDKKDKE